MVLACCVLLVQCVFSSIFSISWSLASVPVLRLDCLVCMRREGGGRKRSEEEERMRDVRD